VLVNIGHSRPHEFLKCVVLYHFCIKAKLRQKCIERTASTSFFVVLLILQIYRYYTYLSIPCINNSQFRAASLIKRLIIPLNILCFNFKVSIFLERVFLVLIMKFLKVTSCSKNLKVSFIGIFSYSDLVN